MERENFKKISWAGQGWDHRYDLTDILKKNKKGFVQGNFDQSLLHLESTQFNKVLTEYLKPFTELEPQQRSGWVCGLGHGVLPKTPEENVRNFVQTVRRVFA